jgi:glutamate N-acetyltransferase/amino-acid N-acetyltransferase
LIVCRALEEEHRDVSDPSDYKTQDLPAGLRLIDGSVTAPQGFRAGNTSCGIKSEAETPDMAMLVADTPCTTAATFTTSRTPAATVTVCKEHLAASGYRAQAVVVNSGNANCATGERGYRDAVRMTELTADKFGLDPALVMVSSTGIIGRPLPMANVEQGIQQLEVSREGGPAYARGIMTTDTRPKLNAVEFEVGGTTVQLGGATKGVGMIYPNMATMLCYMTTDAAVELGFLAQTMRAAVNDSFNMICVDHDMSTNDSAFIFANGLAGNEPLREGTPGAETFASALRYLTRYLAREQARDGEGATKLMIVRVRGGATDADARRAARAVTASPLWQCAVAGGDPNWGRVIAALGASGAELDLNQIELALGGVQVVQGGAGATYDQAAAKQAVAGPDVYVDVNLHAGPHEATAWGCDLTHGYIDENTTYTR